MKVGDMVTWAWQLQADSWESTRFTGIILKMQEVSNGMVLHVLDNTGQKTRIRDDVHGGIEVISEGR